MDYSDDEIKQIFEQWPYEFSKIRPEISICGSPERCIFRLVIEDVSGNKFVLENISKGQLEHKQKIIDTLKYLDKKGLKGVHTYLLVKGDKYIVKNKGKYWQMMPFIDGISLPRPEFINDSWRGDVLANFLVNLRSTSQDIPFFNKEEVFSLPDYITVILGQVRKNRIELIAKLAPYVDHLKDSLFNSYDKLPVSFQHGDYHPINIIWGEDKINSVIDWEFLGYKPEAYDAANLIGCIGFEHPDGLFDELVMTFISTLRKNGSLSDMSLETLSDLILATRFAWVSEWLRKKDEEMLKLELVYMNILMTKKEFIINKWLNIE